MDVYNVLALRALHLFQQGFVLIAVSGVLVRAPRVKLGTV